MLKVNLNGKVILIVDEHRNSALILAAKLMNGGYSSSYVSSCAAACDLLIKEGEYYDAVLVNLDELTGAPFEFPKKLKDDGLSQNIKTPPLAAYSTQKTADYIKKAIGVGYRDFLIRPVEPDVLWDRLARVIDQNQKIDADVFQLEVGEEATARLDIEIVSINEVGVTFYSSVGLEIGVVLSISTPFLEKLEMNGIDARVFHREPLIKAHDDKHYKINAHYISITPKQAQAIRKATFETYRETYGKKAKT